LTMDPNSSVYTYNAGTNRVATVSNTFIEPDGATGPGPDIASNSTFGYDGAGNVNEWDFSSGGVHATYAYDGFNRLASVSNTYQGSITYGQYGYNAFGERTNKRDLRNGNDYSFIYGEGHQLLADREDGIWTNYLWFAGELVAMTRSTAVYDIDSDNLHRPELVTNSSKNVVWQANNDPFGGGDVTPTNAIAFYIGFPGQYFDNDTNYWYNVNRYYVDALGRYLQPDPVGLEMGLNPYVYVGANPANYIDPLGLFGLGFSVGISTINPFPFISAGGGAYGLNVEYTSDQGVQLYVYGTPHDNCSAGFELGAGLSFNYAAGNGSWEGPFQQVDANAGFISFGQFDSPDGSFDSGYYGGQIGFGVGTAFGIGATTTKYTKLFAHGTGGGW